MLQTHSLKWSNNIRMYMVKKIMVLDQHIKGHM